MFSYAQLIFPLMMTTNEDFVSFIPDVKDTYVRQNTEKAYDDENFTCRTDQAGSQIFGSLLLTEFVMHKLLGVGVPSLQYLTSRVRKKPFKKSEFDVALKMIGLLYFQQLLLISFVFLPISGILSLVFLYLTFKFEIFVLKRSQAKPKKPCMLLP